MCLIFTAPSVAPLSFMATNITSDEFMLLWTSPQPIDTNGILREYVVSITEQESGQYVLEDVEVEAGVTEFAVINLIPYTVYSCSVAAVTVARGPEAVITVLTNEEGN